MPAFGGTPLLPLGTAAIVMPTAIDTTQANATTSRHLLRAAR